MKKIFAGAFAVAAVCGIAFADVHVNFYNKLYSEDPVVVHHKNYEKDKYETDVYFPGIKEQMYADIKTDRVDVGVKGTLSLNHYEFDDENLFGIKHDHFFIKGEIDDWWVEFRPFSKATLGLHDTIWADGSYLPIWDDNVTAGNIGSDGFTFIFKPIEQLRLAATIPSGMDYDTAVNWLNDSAEDEEHENFHNFHFGMGAIFDVDMFQVSANIQGIPCSGGRQFGTFINMPGIFGIVKELSIGAGFTHAWGNDWGQNQLSGLIADAGLRYENLMNVYVTYDAGSFGLSAEIAFNFDFDDVNYFGGNGYDFYTAVAVSFGLMDKLTATATGKLLYDFADSSKKGLGLGTGASFAIDYEVNKRNMIGAEVDFNLVDDYWDFAVPVYWKYTLEY